MPKIPEQYTHTGCSGKSIALIALHLHYVEALAQVRVNQPTDMLISKGEWVGKVASYDTQFLISPAQFMPLVSHMLTYRYYQST